jgi:thioredoxin
MEIILNDNNFDTEVNAASKPVVVDFFATWCEPCSMIAPILEKVAHDYEGKIVLMKANLDACPVIATKFGVNQIPTVVLFNNGAPVSGFVGVRPEEVIKEWLEGALKEIQKTTPASGTDDAQKTDSLIRDYIVHAKKNNINLNPSEETVRRVIKGLFANEQKHGEKYCPCRRVTGNKEEDKKNICPCVYHLAEVEKDGHCLCNLFVK